MAIPQLYRKSAGGVLTTFDYTDIAEGTGILHAYGYLTKTDSGLDYNLNSQLTPSVEIETSHSTSTTTYTLEFDQDFDLKPFNITQTVEGTATFNVGLRVNSTSGGGGRTASAYFVFTVYHYDGSTETSIGTVTSETFTSPADGEVQDTCNVNASLATTRFKKGDILRVQVQLYSLHTVGASTVTVGHDPLNRDGSQITPSTDDSAQTKMEFYIPFRIVQ